MVLERADDLGHIRYGHELLEASWDEEAERWQTRTTGGDFTAEILVSAVGALADPSTCGTRCAIAASTASPRSSRRPRLRPTTSPRSIATARTACGPPAGA